MNTILILGASGFIGFPILRKLNTSKNWNVIGTYHRHKPEEEFQFQKLDLLNRKKVSQCLQKIKPDIIVHCAAMSNVDECQNNPELCFKYNVNPAKTVAQYCSRNPSVKYIFFSSSEVFNGMKGEPYVETDICASLSHYGRYKIAAEKIVQSLENSAIIRPCLVYGIPQEYQHRNIFNHIYNSLREGKTFTAYSDMVRSPTYVEDIPMVVEQIIQKNKRGIFHTGGRAISITNFGLTVAEQLDLDKRLIVAKLSDDEVPYKPRNNVLDTSFTQQELGVKFRSIEQAIQEMRGAL